MNTFDQCPRCGTKYPNRVGVCDECQLFCTGFGYEFPVGNYTVFVDNEQHQTEVWDGVLPYLNMTTEPLVVWDVLLSPKTTEDDLLKLLVLE